MKSGCNLATPHKIAGRRIGLKITTDDFFGIYTENGKIVSFGMT
jgi:hypothetical protein